MMTLQAETKYCLESDFVIGLLRNKPNAVATYQKIKDFPLIIPSIVMFEILRGEEEKQDKIDKFNELLKRFDILNFGEKEAREASQIDKSLKKKGERIKIPDLFIGAIAKANDTTLISNDADYKKIENLKLMTY